jgi:hypothetical protein
VRAETNPQTSPNSVPHCTPLHAPRPVTLLLYVQRSASGGGTLAPHRESNRERKWFSPQRLLEKRKTHLTPEPADRTKLTGPEVQTYVRDEQTSCLRVPVRLSSSAGSGSALTAMVSVLRDATSSSVWRFVTQRAWATVRLRAPPGSASGGRGVRLSITFWIHTLSPPAPPDFELSVVVTNCVQCGHLGHVFRGASLGRQPVA